MTELTDGFTHVDTHPEAAALLQGMRATATWPAVRQLRDATRHALEIPAGGALLDVGCGLADVLIDVGRTAADVRLVGIDASDLMLAAAAEDAAAAGVEIELRHGNATALPFEDATFDAVRSERVLQWLDDPVTAVQEMVRVTRPGGAVVLLDTDWRTFAMDVGDPEAERVMAAIITGRPGGDAGGRLRRWALDAGLREVRQHAATAVIDRWSPDEEEGPPGLLPVRVMARTMHESAGIALEEAERLVGLSVDAARRDRFQMQVSLFAVVGRR